MTEKDFRSYSPVTLGLATFGACSLLAFAPAPVSAQDAVRLEEVLVTATRRTETDVQSTPIAVTQVTSDMVERLAPRDLLDVAVYLSLIHI